ncbi:MAG: Asp-tRNA(Asn)/Glu-tRNA(Gln) amidotransferase subunit GatA [Saprospiraceae bacterium]|nr:Asp-tRNA(Asn)/Glu-tRNA(Gln) amidotransferase subunit GatA [Saprospiraceae bacterium]
MNILPPSDIQSLQDALRNGQFTCREVVEFHLKQAERFQHLNAYVELWPEEALQKADETDRLLRERPEKLGRLFGVTVSLKDNICYAGHRVTAASKILEGFQSVFSATAVERILAEGAIIIGRTNCDQFGMGSSNENSVYGPVRNALDEARVPGGSSGGAAVAIQTRTCLLALGSDTGGSVRQPAGFCGIWGFKPTYGRISRHGLLAYGSSFDQIGILANTPDDIALALEIMAGPDEYDSTALQTPLSTITSGKTKIKIAIFPQVFESQGLESGVRAITEVYIEQLREAGHVVENVEFDLLEYIIPTYYVLTTAEASSNLSRYDGVRYGYRNPNARTLEETYLLSRSEGFSDEVKRRILLGTFVLSSGYYDAYYSKAQQARRMIKNRIDDIFKTYDFILMPVAPSVAWRFGEKSDDPVAMYLSDIYTVLANLAGVPALAFPIGEHPELNLPVGAQLMAAYGEDWRLLDIKWALMNAE